MGARGHRTRGEAVSLREAMLHALREAPCRSSELFGRVSVSTRTGRDTLDALIDDGIVVVDRDWTLSLSQFDQLAVGVKL